MDLVSLLQLTIERHADHWLAATRAPFGISIPSNTSSRMTEWDTPYDVNHYSELVQSHGIIKNLKLTDRSHRSPSINQLAEFTAGKKTVPTYRLPKSQLWNTEGRPSLQFREAGRLALNQAQVALFSAHLGSEPSIERMCPMQLWWYPSRLLWSNVRTHWQMLRQFPHPDRLPQQHSLQDRPLLQ